MKKLILAIVLLLSASVNAAVMYGRGVRTLSTNNITGYGLVAADALPHYADTTCDRGCGCGCGFGY